MTIQGGSTKKLLFLERKDLGVVEHPLFPTPLAKKTHSWPEAEIVFLPFLATATKFVIVSAYRFAPSQFQPKWLKDFRARINIDLVCQLKPQQQQQQLNFARLFGQIHFMGRCYF